MSTNKTGDGPVERAEPESLRARSLSVSLTVTDLEKSLAWYHDIARFTIDEKYTRDGKVNAVSLKAGAVRLVIGQDDGARGWDRVKGQGFSLHLSTAQDIDEMAQSIKERGGVLESEPADMPWGARQFRLRDPDGYTFAISSEKA